nr:NADH dehydrogenase subunit 2 [Sarmydus sp. N117]
MIKFYKLLFSLTLMIGTLIAVSAYSWMSMWIGLEINLLSIIPLLKEKENLYPSESALKYFIVQALASAILLFSLMILLNTEEFINYKMSQFSFFILNSAILTKMGAAPFHFWFPEVMGGLSWMNALIMLTWQKLAPMVLLMYNINMTLFLSGIIVLSSVIGGAQGLNQVSLRKIMAYSSINHMGWMLSSMLNFQSIWLIYYATYTLISTNIIIIFQNLNIFHLKQLFNSMKNNYTVKILITLNFLSLGGLPPFLGFLPKWFTINNLVQNGFFLISVILITTTLITLYFYLRITFSALLISSKETFTRQSQFNNMFLITTINFVSLTGMAACTLIFNAL